MQCSGNYAEELYLNTILDTLFISPSFPFFNLIVQFVLITKIQKNTVFLSILYINLKFLYSETVFKSLSFDDLMFPG